MWCRARPFKRAPQAGRSRSFPPAGAPAVLPRCGLAAGRAPLPAPRAAPGTVRGGRAPAPAGSPQCPPYLRPSPASLLLPQSRPWAWHGRCWLTSLLLYSGSLYTHHDFSTSSSYPIVLAFSVLTWIFCTFGKQQQAGIRLCCCTMATALRGHGIFASGWWHSFLMVVSEPS